MPKTKRVLLIVIGITCLGYACTNDFDEINANPNTPEQVSPRFLLSNVIWVSADRNTYEQGFRLSNYLAQFAASVEFERVDRYEMGTNADYWNTIFGLLTDIQSMKEVEGTNEAYAAVGDIMRCHLYSQLTDLWGDVPYSETLLANTGEFTPRYDDQESIYTGSEGILAVLEAAVNTLNSTATTVQGDMMFDGDLDQWARFANSLRVRYLLRISNRLTDFSTLQTLVDEDQLMRSNDDNAVIPYLSAAPNQWPMSQAAQGLYQEHRMTQTVDSVLSKWNDPRVAVLYRPTQQSVNEGTPAYRGLANGQSRETISTRAIELNDISLFGTRFRDVPDGADAQLMQYAELQFALAEAAQRGYISGDARAYYERGIAASFDYYGVALPGDYLAQTAVAWSDNPDANLTNILTQKWLSLINVGHEAWFNVRRTGVPRLTPGPDNLNDGRYPVRYLYPESEQATNSENYRAAAERIGGDNINSLNWWEQ